MALSARLRERMTQDLQLAGLSERTQEAYLYATSRLARHWRQSPELLTEDQIRSYFLFLRNELRYSPATIRLAVHGIRFFYRSTAPRHSPTLEMLHVPCRIVCRTY